MRWFRRKGSFTIRVGGRVTKPIPHTASAKKVKRRLRAIAPNWSVESLSSNPLEGMNIGGHTSRRITFSQARRRYFWKTPGVVLDASGDSSFNGVEIGGVRVIVFYGGVTLVGEDAERWAGQ